MTGGGGEFRELFERGRKDGSSGQDDGETYDLPIPQAEPLENHEIAWWWTGGGPRGGSRPDGRLVEMALRHGNGIMEVVEHQGRQTGFSPSRAIACVTCGTSIPELEPDSFSFNSPYGACEDGGAGTRKEVNSGAGWWRTPSLSS